MKQLLLILLLFPILFNSCINNANEEQKELLVGSWIFESGTRNGTIEGTELLENLIFDFSDKELSCELLDEMKPGLKEKEAYELKDNLIVVGKTLNIELKEVSQEQLLVKFEVIIQENPFEFDLKFKRQ